jgi:tetratricopeptide (TPR) repeat protein
MERLGRNAEAVPHFEAALGDDPNHPKAHYNLGNALAHCAEYESCEVWKILQTNRDSEAT